MSEKDSARIFSQEQRRILWNTTGIPRCSVCHKLLSWHDFTIDHKTAHSIGGATRLDNAELMCRKDNSGKGNKLRIPRSAKFRRVLANQQ
ncbi:MAG: HNH endonuclease signature motif containing protein [Pyrinomonadaceae bacterium]